MEAFNTDRRMRLYRIDDDGTSHLICSKFYKFTTASHELQIACKLAKDCGYCKSNDGVIFITDLKDTLIDRIDIPLSCS